MFVEGVLMLLFECNGDLEVGFFEKLCSLEVEVLNGLEANEVVIVDRFGLLYDFLDLLRLRALDDNPQSILDGMFL